MADISKKLAAACDAHHLTNEEAANQLGVSRASFYNYLAKKDMPRIEILQRAAQIWDLHFEYLEPIISRRALKSSPSQAIQLALPFIKALREEDIQIIKVTPKEPNAVELRVMIKFAG